MRNWKLASSLFIVLFCIVFAVVGCTSAERPGGNGESSDVEPDPKPKPKPKPKPEKNECGGTAELKHLVGASCDSSNACAKWVCDGEDKLACRGQVNGCGGCQKIDQIIGDKCGECGSITCTGENTIHCQENKNACGGCETLSYEIGALCHNKCKVGKYVCDGKDSQKCSEDIEQYLNPCGGCQKLPDYDKPCGDCQMGKWVCDGEDKLKCDGATEKNACGGCSELDGSLLEKPCGLCGNGKYACSDDKLSLICDGDNPDECNQCLSTAPNSDGYWGFSSLISGTNKFKDNDGTSYEVRYPILGRDDRHIYALEVEDTNAFMTAGVLVPHVELVEPKRDFELCVTFIRKKTIEDSKANNLKDDKGRDLAEEKGTYSCPIATTESVLIPYASSSEVYRTKGCCTKAGTSRTNMKAEIGNIDNFGNDNSYVFIKIVQAGEKVDVGGDLDKCLDNMYTLRAKF